MNGTCLFYIHLNPSVGRRAFISSKAGAAAASALDVALFTK